MRLSQPGTTAREVLAPAMKWVSVWWWLGKLDSRKPELRARAVQRLAELKSPRAVEPIAKLLHDEQRGLRAAAAQALGIIGHPSAVGPLVATLLDEKYWDVRHEVVESLRLIGDPKAVNELLLIIERPDQDQSIRQFSAWALREFAWEKLAPEQQTEICILRDDWGEVCKLGSGAVGPLVTAMRQGTHRVRREAAEALARIGDARAIGTLVEMLRDEDRGVRVAAATVLDRHTWSRLDEVSAALVAVTLEKWPQVVGAGPAAVDPLLEAIRSGEPASRERAVQALGEIGGTRAIWALKTTLREGDPSLRRAAATALGFTHDPEAIAALVSAAGDKDYGVVEAAASALSRTGWSPDSAADRARLAVAAKNWHAAVDLGEAAVGPLMTAIHYPPARFHAFAALAEIGTAAVEPLVSVLQSHDTPLRLCAAEALGEIGDERAIAALEKTLTDKDPGVRHAAVRSLEHCGWHRGSVSRQVELGLAVEDWPRITELGTEAVAPLMAMVQADRFGEPALHALELVLQSEAAGQISPVQLSDVAALSTAPAWTAAAHARGGGGKPLQAVVARRRVSQLARTELQRRRVPAAKA